MMDNTKLFNLTNIYKDNNSNYNSNAIHSNKSKDNDEKDFNSFTDLSLIKLNYENNFKRLKFFCYFNFLLNSTKVKSEKNKNLFYLNFNFNLIFLLFLILILIIKFIASNFIIFNKIYDFGPTHFRQVNLGFNCFMIFTLFLIIIIKFYIYKFKTSIQTLSKNKRKSYSKEISLVLSFLINLNIIFLTFLSKFVSSDGFSNHNNISSNNLKDYLEAEITLLFFVNFIILLNFLNLNFSVFVFFLLLAFNFVSIIFFIINTKAYISLIYTISILIFSFFNFIKFETIINYYITKYELEKAINKLNLNLNCLNSKNDENIINNTDDNFNDLNCLSKEFPLKIYNIKVSCNEHINYFNNTNKLKTERFKTNNYNFLYRTNHSAVQLCNKEEEICLDHIIVKEEEKIKRNVEDLDMEFVNCNNLNLYTLYKINSSFKREDNTNFKKEDLNYYQSLYCEIKRYISYMEDKNDNNNLFYLGVYQSKQSTLKSEDEAKEKEISNNTKNINLKIYIRKDLRKYSLNNHYQLFVFQIYNISDYNDRNDKNKKQKTKKETYKHLLQAKLSHEFKYPLMLIQNYVDQILEKENFYIENDDLAYSNYEYYNNSNSFKENLVKMKYLAEILILTVLDLGLYISDNKIKYSKTEVSYFSKNKLQLSPSNNNNINNLNNKVNILDFNSLSLISIFNLKEYLFNLTKSMLLIFNKDLPFEIIVEDNLINLKFLTNEKKLKQILSNLIANAIKFTIEGYIIIHINESFIRKPRRIQTIQGYPPINNNGNNQLPKNIINILKPNLSTFKENTNLTKLNKNIKNEQISNNNFRPNSINSNRNTVFKHQYSKKVSFLIESNKNIFSSENDLDTSNLNVKTSYNRHHKSLKINDEEFARLNSDGIFDIYSLKKEFKEGIFEDEEDFIYNNNNQSSFTIIIENTGRGMKENIINILNCESLKSYQDIKDQINFKNKTYSTEQGLGAGLLIIKSLCNELNIKLKAENEYSKDNSNSIVATKIFLKLFITNYKNNNLNDEIVTINSNNHTINNSNIEFFSRRSYKTLTQFSNKTDKSQETIKMYNYGMKINKTNKKLLRYSNLSETTSPLSSVKTELILRSDLNNKKFNFSPSQFNSNFKMLNFNMNTINNGNNNNNELKNSKFSKTGIRYLEKDGEQQNTKLFKIKKDKEIQLKYLSPDSDIKKSTPPTRLTTKNNKDKYYINENKTYIPEFLINSKLNINSNKNIINYSDNDNDLEDVKDTKIIYVKNRQFQINNNNNNNKFNRSPLKRRRKKRTIKNSNTNNLCKKKDTLDKIKILNEDNLNLLKQLKELKDEKTLIVNINPSTNIYNKFSTNNENALEEINIKNDKEIKNNTNGKLMVDMNSNIKSRQNSNQILDCNSKILPDFVILIVDDNFSNQLAIENLINKYLKSENLKLGINSNNNINNKYNIKVKKLNDGIELLNEIYNDIINGLFEIKIVFCDQMMSFLNGSDAFKIIKQIYEDKNLKMFPFAICSAFNDSGFYEKMKQSNIEYIFEKPVTIGNIEFILSKTLSN